MLLENGHWKDDNGNLWWAKGTSEAEAQAKSDSLVNCHYCDECENCTNCRECSCCTDCTDCSYCRDCHNCSNCAECQDCEGCKTCEDCRNCANCTECYFCDECQSCDFCDNCNDCESCKHLNGRSNQFELDDTYQNGDMVKLYPGETYEAEANYIGKYGDEHVVFLDGQLLMVEAEKISK